MTHEDPTRAIAELRTLPLLAELDPSATDRLIELAELRTYAPSARIVEQGEAAGELFLVARGEVAIRQGRRLARLAQAPCVLGLQALVEGGARTASLEAATEVTLLSLDRSALELLTREQPSFSSSLVRLLGAELGRMYRREANWLEHMADYFHSPNARIVPGPYVAAPYDMILLVMQGRPDALRALMPPGVSPARGLEGLFILSFNFFESLSTPHPQGERRSFSYSEAATFVPCVGPDGEPGVFSPEIYPDNLLAITIGRELYGLPKRFGVTVRRDEQVDLLLDDRLLVRARWAGAEPCGVGDLPRRIVERRGGGPALALLAEKVTAALHAVGAQRAGGQLPVPIPVMVHRQVPAVSPAAGRHLATDRLLRVPLRMSSVRTIRELGDPSVIGPPADHYLHGRCLCGFEARVAFELHQATVLRDYLREPEPPRGPARRLLRRLLATGATPPEGAPPA
jgi:CRP-like cAMP-binding protein